VTTSISGTAAIVVTGAKSATASRGRFGIRCGTITCAEALARNIEPPGAARATTSLPIVPFAPLRFSTTTGCGSSRAKPWATMRAMMSVGPPGG
jgi:hypothetical protein